MCNHPEVAEYDVFSDIGWVTESVCVECEEVLSVVDNNGRLVAK